jgi:hypothetical protein
MSLEFPGGGRRPSSLLAPVTERVSTSVRAGLLAVLMVVDVGGRVLPRLLARLLDTDLVPVAVSLLLGTLTGSNVITTVAPFALYGYLVYTLVPKLLPGQLGHVTERRDFRLLATVYALLVPVLALTSGPEWDSLLLLSGLVVLPLYLVAVQRGAILGRDGYPVATSVAFFPFTDSFENWFEDGLDVRDRTPTFWFKFVAMSVISVMYSWFVFLIVGVLVFFLSLTYPVPEFLISGWLGQRALRRAPVGPEGRVLDRERLDLETRVLSVVGVALEGFKGFTSVVMAATGFGWGVVFLWIAVYNVRTFVDLAARTATFSPARLLIVIVGTLTLWGLAFYGVWYWVRMLTRGPSFLAAWRDELTAEVQTEPEREDQFLPTRPPGYFLPPVLLWGLLPATQSGSWESPQLPPAWGVLAWLAAFALTAWTAYRALAAAPQPARTDQRALPLSFCVATVGTWIGSDLTTDGQYDLSASYVVGLLTGRVSVEQFLAALAAPGATLAVGLITIPLYGFWVEDVIEWRRRDDWRKYAYVPYFLLAAAALGISAALVGNFWSRGLFAVCAVAVFGVMALGLLSDVGVVETEW